MRDDLGLGSQRSNDRCLTGRCQLSESLFGVSGRRAPLLISFEGRLKRLWNPPVFRSVAMEYLSESVATLKWRPRLALGFGRHGRSDWLSCSAGDWQPGDLHTTYIARYCNVM